MTSPTSRDDFFEPDRISASVSDTESLQFLQEHGFFYQGNHKIGELVDDLYRTGRARSDDARLECFKPILRQDSRLSTILNHYRIELPRFRFPWGTTPGVYYNWDIKSSPMVDSGLVAYMLGPGSRWVCRDGSLGIDEDGHSAKNGTLQIPESSLENYPEREINMEQGGV